MNRRCMLALISMTFGVLGIAVAAGTASAQSTADMEGVKAASKAFYVALAALDGGTAMGRCGRIRLTSPTWARSANR